MFPSRNIEILKITDIRQKVRKSSVFGNLIIRKENIISRCNVQDFLVISKPICEQGFISKCHHSICWCILSYTTEKNFE